MRFSAFTRVTSCLIFLAAWAGFCCLATAQEAPRAPGFSLDEIDRMDREILSLDLSDVDPSSPAAFEDIPMDHWAYRSVQHLAALGLLGGYNGGQFRGDQVVTRYELAVIVSKMLDNYQQYLRRGYVEYTVPVDAALPPTYAYPPPQPGYASPVPERSPRVIEAPAVVKSIKDAYATVPSPGVMIPAPGRIPSGAAPRSASNRPMGDGEVAIGTGRSIAGDPYAFRTENPYEQVLPPVGQATAGAGLHPSPAGLRKRVAPSVMEIPPAPAPDKDKDKDADKDKDKDKDKGKDNDKVKIPKELKKVSKDFELTAKDVAIFETLLDYVNDSLKDMKKETDKSIKEIRSMAQKNQRDIDTLEEENQRYKVSGSAYFEYGSSHVVEGAESDTKTSAYTNYHTSFDVYSRPRKFDDLVLRTNYYGGDTRIEYQDFTEDIDNPREFKLRSLYAGQVSTSGLTQFTTGLSGVTMRGGFTASLKLNDYAITATMGRVTNLNVITETSYPTYLYGVQLQTNLFNNPSSLLYITRFSSWEDADQKNSNDEDNVMGCYSTDGDWTDTFYPIGSFTSEDSICLPPSKNSVTSVFFRYPLNDFVPGLNLTGEFLHSSYYRPGFKMSMDNSNSASNYDNTFQPSMEYITWRDVPEQVDSDDAFAILFDYNKGPLTIMPSGYVHLGNKFSSRYLSLPTSGGFSLDLLPISVQSLDAILLWGEYKKLKQKYKYNFLYVDIKEHTPMFLDPSAMASEPTIVTQFAAIDRLNNRDSELMIKGGAFSNTLTYYLTDDIQLEAGFTTFKVNLGPGCVDANQIEVRDEFGTVIDKTIGDGAKNCGVDEQDISPDIQVRGKQEDYSLFWRTSKRSEFKIGWGSSKFSPKISLGAGSAVDEILNDLVPFGTKYSFSTSFKYRLTDVSNINLWYNRSYNRPMEGFAGTEVDDIDDYLIDNKGYHSVGIRIEMNF